MTPAATGMLMLPWSVASFLAITATGRYFNRIGPRPLVVIGCLLQATGILLLVNVGPAMLLPAVAFALMGAGGSLCSSTAQSSAFLTMRPENMPDASALWNLNRQLSFFCGCPAAGAGAELHAGLSLAAGSPGTGCLFLPQSSLYCPYCTSTVLTTRSYLRNCNRSNHDPFRTRDPRHSRRP